ncbi:MAG: prepilin-type N-terminal cleavage/methylation domain-containing protein [Lachnospiraceae bacterium]
MKNKMEKSTNKGFTLIEVMVSVAILSFVMLGIMFFMTTGSKLYAMVSYKQAMLTESQLLMAQINDKLMDCNEGIAWDDSADTLYIVQKTEGETEDSYQIHYYKLDGTDLLYKTITGTSADLAGINDIKAAFDLISDDTAKLAEYLDTFEIEISLKDGEIVDSVEVTTGFARGGEAYKGTQMIYMRNQPIISSAVNATIDVLMDELTEE